jgi:cytochrome d ubiquinol oxidase subunit I
VDFFGRSFRMGAWTALIFSVLVAVQGHSHGNEVAETQPEKLAAMESLWETEKGAPMYLLLMPNISGEGNMVEALPIPNMLSILAYSDPDAEVMGLNDVPEQNRPPVLLTFLSFRAMVGLGTLFILIGAFAVWKRKTIQDYPWFLKILPWLIPLPYIAIQAGWIVAEVGRQPWIVYGLMRTSDAVSPVTTGQVGVSLVALTLLYTLLGIVGFWIIIRYARKGPKPADARFIGGNSNA